MDISKNVTLKYLLFIIIISLPLMGGDCEKILGESGTVPSDMVGRWQLTEQTGAQFDICPNETVEFQSGGVANLTCPNQSTVTRNVNVSGNVLTYTQSGVEYNVELTSNNNLLNLYGINVSRNLSYQRIVTDNAPSQNSEGTSFKNSSEGEN